MPSDSTLDSLVPVYNVPMALDQTLTHTYGLEPEGAKSRNKRNIGEARSYVVGPMPVFDFIGDFVTLQGVATRSDAFLESEGAFCSVPESAPSVAGISEPLVSTNILGNLGMICHIRPVFAHSSLL